MASDRLDVLIVGAGIAGSAVAALLGRSGHRVVLVEKDQGIRSSGNPVDVRGAASGVLDRLGVLATVRERATRVDQVVFVGDAGRSVGTLRTQRTPDRDFEVSRSDLSAILVEAARPFVEIRFDDTVTAIDQLGRRVHVESSSTLPQARSIWSLVPTGFIRRLGAWCSARRIGWSVRSACMWPASR